MNQCIIIKSIGRAGSHIVRKHFINSRFLDVEYHPHVSIPYNKELWRPVERATRRFDTVVHTHSRYNPMNSQDWICLLVNRRSIFDQICSCLIVDKTQEFTNYSNIHLEPFVANLDRFCHYHTELIERQSKLEKSIDSVKWKKLLTLYYEDIVSDPEYLKNKCPWTGNYTKVQYKDFQKSPFPAKEFILNYTELLQEFSNMQLTNK